MPVRLPVSSVLGTIGSVPWYPLLPKVQAESATKDRLRLQEANQGGNKMIVVSLPNPTTAGAWWEWGTYDTVEEAVAALQEQGIPVDEDGYLQVLTELYYSD
jgi:hypothetical protein